MPEEETSTSVWSTILVCLTVIAVVLLVCLTWASADRRHDKIQKEKLDLTDKCFAARAQAIEGHPSTYISFIDCAQLGGQ